MSELTQPAQYVRLRGAYAAVLVAGVVLLAALGSVLARDVIVIFEYDDPGSARVPSVLCGSVWAAAIGLMAFARARTGAFHEWRDFPRAFGPGLMFLAATFDLASAVTLTLAYEYPLDGSDAVDVVVLAGLGLVAWRWPVLGGWLLLVLGTVLLFAGWFNSVTVRGEPNGVLFGDDDSYFVVMFGLLPIVAGICTLLLRPRPRLVTLEHETGGADER